MVECFIYISGISVFVVLGVLTPSEHLIEKILYLRKEISTDDWISNCSITFLHGTNGIV